MRRAGEGSRPASRRYWPRRVSWLTDDEAAAVLGHEIAHGPREHGRERVSQQLATSTVLGVGAAILGVGGGWPTSPPS